MVIIQEERLGKTSVDCYFLQLRSESYGTERNPAGKIVKTNVRKRAAEEWEKRKHKAENATAKL